MNKKQKICLWMGLGVIDVVGLLTLGERYDDYGWGATDFLILLILIAITTFTVFLHCKSEKPKDGQKNNRSNSINPRKGFQRVACVLSLVAALILAVVNFDDVFSRWHYEREQYEEYKKDQENIVRFWFNWNTGRWEGGNPAVVSYLLNVRAEYPETASFIFDNTTVYFDIADVFPGINNDMRHMSLSMLEEKAQIAAEEAFRGIERKVQRYERWGEMPLSKVRFLAILAALVGAAIGYLPIWVVFGIISWVIVPSVSKFVRWLALGFRDDMAEQVVNVEQTLEHESENLEKENPVPEQAPVG